MGLLDDLNTPPARIFPCKVRDVASKLDKDDAKVLIEAVEGEVWKISQLSVALANKGIQISQPAIKSHRLKNCSCSKI